MSPLGTDTIRIVKYYTSTNIRSQLLLCHPFLIKVQSNPYNYIRIMSITHIHNRGITFRNLPLHPHNLSSYMVRTEIPISTVIGHVNFVLLQHHQRSIRLQTTHYNGLIDMKASLNGCMCLSIYFLQHELLQPNLYHCISYTRITSLISEFSWYPQLHGTMQPRPYPIGYIRLYNINMGIFGVGTAQKNTAASFCRLGYQVSTTPGRSGSTTAIVLGGTVLGVHNEITLCNQELAKSSAEDQPCPAGTRSFKNLTMICI